MKRILIVISLIVLLKNILAQTENNGNNKFGKIIYDSTIYYELDIVGKVELKMKDSILNDYKLKTEIDNISENKEDSDSVLITIKYRLLSTKGRLLFSEYYDSILVCTGKYTDSPCLFKSYVNVYNPLNPLEYYILIWNYYVPMRDSIWQYYNYKGELINIETYKNGFLINKN